MEIFPVEIVTEILRRLPAQSLCRFKTVSKTWLSLITDPHFTKLHQDTVHLTRLICHSLSFSQPISTLPSFTYPETPTRTLSFPNTVLYMFHFHASCNGIVLATAFLNSDSRVSFSTVFDRLVILNPTTREFVKLSETQYETFDENYRDYRCGFGYDSVSDDYKVVTLAYYHIHNRDPSVPIYVHVYSLRSNTWRRVMDYPYPYDHHLDPFGSEKVAGVLVNGFVHWVATKLVGNGLVRVIAAFSLADETFTEVPSPPDVFDITHSKRLGKLVDFGGKLGVFKEDGVWLMNEYGVSGSWSKVAIYGFDEIPNDVSLIHFEDRKILLVNKKLLRVYDVDKETFINTVDLPKDIEGMVSGTYVESLVSLKSSTSLTIHKFTNSSGSEPATSQADTGDSGRSDGRGRSGGRGGSRDSGRRRSGGRGRFGGGGRVGGRGGRGRGGRGRY